MVHDITDVPRFVGCWCGRSGVWVRAGSEVATPAVLVVVQCAVCDPTGIVFRCEGRIEVVAKVGDVSA